MKVSSAVRTAYEEVRSDKHETDWALFSYTDDTSIDLKGKGTGGLKSLVPHLTEKERFFGYVRFKTGDDLSSRSKFVFIAWVGEGVPPLKKARMSTDKAVVKETVSEFSVEVFATTLDDMNESTILDAIARSSGANYGSSST